MKENIRRLYKSVKRGFSTQAVGMTLKGSDIGRSRSTQEQRNVLTKCYEMLGYEP
jgi:hypothetical protein